MYLLLHNYYIPYSFPGGNVIVGQLASDPFLLDVKQRIQEQLKFAGMGGGREMEGWAQYTHIMRDYPDKGVADYADGEKDGRWQLTAANYTHFQLQPALPFMVRCIIVD